MYSYSLRFLVNWKESFIQDHHFRRKIWQAISIRRQETVNLGEVLSHVHYIHCLIL